MNKKIAKRSRNKQLIFRFSEKEIEKINKKLEKVKTKNRSDFFLLCLDNKPIIEIDGIHELMTELKRIGNNVNQIAIKLNQGQEQQVKSTLEEINKTCAAVQEFLNDVNIQTENKKSGARKKKENVSDALQSDTKIIKEQGNASFLLPRPAKISDAVTDESSIVPNCPNCGKPMVKRQNGKIWGCVDYFKTKCNGLIPILEEKNADI